MAGLEVAELTVSIAGMVVLDGLSFILSKGERMGVIGEGGAGKSALVATLLGLLPPTSSVTGTISLDGVPVPATEIERAKLRGNRIGVVFQDAGAAFDPLMTLGDHISEVLTRAGETGDVKAAAEAILTAVGLTPGDALRYPADLSAGALRCAALAVALAGKPDWLIADDPLAGLDLIMQRKLLDLIETNCSARGMGLVLISHDLKALAAVCTKVLVLRQGKLIELGDKTEVFGRPKHDYTRALMAAGRHRARTLMRAPIGASLLDLRGVSRRFSDPLPSLLERRPATVALDGLSLTVRLGESLALIGPSGAGKSTLLRIVAGLDRATSGELEYEHQVYHGRDLPRTVRHDISFVLPDPATSFNPRLTLGESIAEPLGLIAEQQLDELSVRIVETVNAVGLSDDILGRRPHEFGSGDLQRCAIARALVTRPRLVLLDEPVARLDVFSRSALLVLLNRLRADYGLTFLVAGHDLEMIRIIADRVVVMDRGRVVETGTPAQLLDKPQEPLTKVLVAAALPDVGIVPVF